MGSFGTFSMLLRLRQGSLLVIDVFSEIFSGSLSYLTILFELLTRKVVM